MSLKLRNETWWLDVQINGRRVRESLKTSDKQEAQQLHDIRRAELWQQRTLKAKPSKTFNDACTRWKRDTAHKKSTRDDNDKIAFFKPHLGNMLLTDIKRDTVEDLLPAGVTPATRNRYRALVRSILRAAVDWEWIDRAPKFKLEPEPQRRVAYLTRQQASDLINALPEQYRNPVRFALLTGLRRSNVFNLRWEDVNLDAGTAIVHADEAKAGELILVPLNTAARELLSALPGRTGRVWGDLVCVWHSVWKTATRRVGVEWCRFHDLRHTWASWHAMAGTPLSVLQELGGWHSPAMVKKYAHLSPEHLAAAAERIAL